MKTDEQLRAYMASHPGMTPGMAYKNLYRHGITVADIVRAVGAPGKKLFAPASSQAAVEPRKRSLAEFVAQHDVGHKIRAGVKRLGRENYMLEGEFREFCGVHVNVWRRHAEQDEFAPFRLKLHGQVYWGGSPELVAQMKHVVGVP